MRFKKIMLADPNALAREGLKHLLGRRDNSLIFVDVANDDDFIRAGYSHHYNAFSLIIVHASLLAVGQNPDLTAYLYKTGTRIILLCDQLTPALDAKIKCFGIQATLSCQDSISRLEQTILGLLEQESSAEDQLDMPLAAILPTGRSMACMSQSEQRDLLYRRIESLTAKQKLVLSYLKAGLMNKEIAFEMGIQESTVKRHVSDILQKLELKKRTQLIKSVTF